MKKIFGVFIIFGLFYSCTNNPKNITPKVNPDSKVENVVSQDKKGDNISSFSKIQFRGEAQGTYYSITYFDALNRNLKYQIDSLLQAFDLSASNYVSASIISKVNANIPVEIDDIFRGNFLLSQEVSAATQGDYDITVRPLVELWGFGKKEASEVNQYKVDSILQFTGYQKVKLLNNKIYKEDPRVQLDFNAIAQGYSVDVTSAYLRTLGISNFLVDIGGEVYASGMKPDSLYWQVGIERPKDNEAYGESLSAIVSLKDKGMATSGNYRKFYIKNGVKYSHTIDPHTGRPAQRKLLSATIIAQNAAHADAYATACMVMGVKKSIEFLSKHPEMDGFLIYSDENGNYKNYHTQGLSQFLEEE